MTGWCRNRWTGVIAGLLLALAAWIPARACTTPVYRYAMYNWRTSPYVVLYFHRGEPAEEDAKVNQLLSEMSRAEPPANVVFEPVNLDAENPLERYPEPVKTAFEAHEGDKPPVHMVMTPWLAELHTGRLSEADLKPMVESPMRTRLAELVDEGNAAVLVFVPGKDDAANQEARAVIKQLIDQAASGETFPGFSDMAAPEPVAQAEDTPDDSDESPTDDSAGLQLATIEVSRTDPAEAWFVKTLMTVEPDLDEYSEEPMVFAVYGRGRAMPPYIGKGITVELLTDVLAFLVGPCSCFAKAENPGMDLLARWDWDATADRMAANDPTLFPDPTMYQEFAVGQPEEKDSETETPPDDSLLELAAATDPDAAELVAATIPEMVAETEASATEPKPASQEVEGESTDGASEKAEAETPATVRVDSAKTAANVPVDADRSSGSFTSGFAWRLALALVLGAVVVVVAGFALMRKQG